MTKRTRIGIAVGAVFAVVLLGWTLHVLGYGDPRLKAGRSLAVVCRMYADEHDSNFPPSLAQLAPSYINVHDLPRLLDAGGVRYVYVPGRTLASPPDAVLLYSAEAVRFGSRYVVLVDGSGKLVTERELQRLLRDAPPPVADRTR